MTEENTSAVVEVTASDNTQTDVSNEIDHSSEATPRDAIDRAFSAYDSENEQDQSAQIETEQVEQVDNHEEPQEQEKVEELTTFAEAPNRFSADAKQAWKDAPEPVRAEITRAISELENGINQYREAYEPFKDFAKQVYEQGGEPGQVIQSYIGIENMLMNDPINGLDQVISQMRDAGVLQVGTLRELVGIMSGQTPDQTAVLQDQTIRELRNEISALKQDLGGVSTSIKSQSEAAAMKEIEAFAAQNPRFDDLSEDIAFFLNSGKAKNLQEAYSLAERLNPAPQAPAPAIVAQQAAQPVATAQPRKGNLSITGAPGSGSNPSTRKAPATAREAIDNAFARIEGL